MIKLKLMNSDILIDDLIEYNQIVLIIEKNFFENGKYEILFDYETRPSIKDFRSNEDTSGDVNPIVVDVSGNLGVKTTSASLGAVDVLGNVSITGNIGIRTRLAAVNIGF